MSLSISATTAAFLSYQGCTYPFLFCHAVPHIFKLPVQVAALNSTLSDSQYCNVTPLPRQRQLFVLLKRWYIKAASILCLSWYGVARLPVEATFFMFRWKPFSHLVGGWIPVRTNLLDLLHHSIFVVLHISVDTLPWLKCIVKTMTAYKFLFGMKSNFITEIPIPAYFFDEAEEGKSKIYC